MVSTYDVTVWNRPVFRYDGLSAALASGFKDDGIHQIGLANGKSLDLLIQGLGILEDCGGQRVLLVGFTGAVLGSEHKKAPYFSGLGIASSLRLPIIAVSDPTLAIDNTLGLAWYAGNEDVPKFPEQMALLLDHIARQHHARLLLFGGSGGGFAALLMASLLNIEATVVVWNPQTAIADYVPKFVGKYFKVAFPLKAKALCEESGNQSDYLYRALNEAGIIHDVRGLTLGRKVELLYLQNRSDWHLARHAGPYLSGKDWTRIGQAAFVDTKQQCAIFFGEWGEGHAVPDKAMLNAVIGQLAAGKRVADVAHALDKGLPGICGAPQRFCWFSSDPAFRLEAKAWLDDTGDVRGLVIQREGETEGQKYAFFLLVDGVCLAMRWYEPSPEMVFKSPDTTGNLELVAFAQDGIGSRMSVRVPIIKDTACRA